MIVNSNTPVTLLGAAPVSPGLLARVLARAPRLVAADGGAETALAAGHMPEAVIGDFDSLGPAARGRIPDDRQHRIAEQDSTDFDKALRHVSAPLILGAGFLGGRSDHQMAACNSLVRFAHQRCVLIGESELILLAPPILRLDLPAGCVVSLFPLGAVEGRSSGLDWPLDGIAFAPDGRIGTSNRAQGPVELVITAPKMLLILPAATLDAVLGGLESCVGSWR